MSEHRTPAPITLIAGPTASGKSALALDLARRTGAVIVNADSQQLYADLHVLSARPTPADMEAAEHRLYGVADAADPWSVGRWTRAAAVALAELARADRPVVIVGGTGLYFAALTKGLADIPEVPVAARDAAATALDEEGEASFRRRLSELDPEAEARISKGDRQRLVRAMAVAEHTGQALSRWKAATRPVLDPGSWTGWVLEPDRETLYRQCDARARWMVRHGALEEVARLIARGLDPELPAMKAVGVRELAAALRGEVLMEQALEDLMRATRNYAKRQLTWFRNQTPEWSRLPPEPLAEH